MIRALCKYNSVNFPFRTAFGRLFALFLLGFIAIASAQERSDVAMITGLQGTANLLTPQGIQALQPFSRLQQGDQLLVDNPALLKLIFFDGGRQEIWQGTGRIEIMESEGKGFGWSAPDVIVKVLSVRMVKQIEKTPTTGALPRGGNTRLRSIGGESSIKRVEDSYRKMRMEAVQGDLNPELFLLSALFEMREIDRVEQVLSDLRATRPADQEARMVIALYQKAVRNFKEGGGK
ncbi:hypothetical protein [Propionivibrio sp.]|uniref:hypothetical protein n=1 Tax=Propionivibrio sp. TaxID=2212460 RepID=UPI003BF28300